MSRFVVGFILPLILTLSHAAVTAQTKSVGSSKDEAAIKALLGDFSAAWNKHDARAFSLVFAEDADFTNVQGTGASGRAEIEKFHATRFATNFKDSHQKISKIKIRFIKPDVATVDAWWEMTGAKTAEGVDVPLRLGLLNFVMTKESGKWLIVVMHNMNLPVPSQTPSSQQP